MPQFIFWGFNFVVGYAFIVGLNKSFAPVGTFLPVIIFIGALISFIVGYSFARMSKRYYSNGGVYLYSRQTFGKNFAYYAGFWQYIQAPVIALSAFLGMLWAFKGIILPGQPHEGATYTWWIAILAAFLFISSYVITVYGFSSTKWSLYFLWAIKWLVIIFSMVLALILAKHFYDNIFKSPANPFSNPHGFKISTANFIQSIITFFFAFGGFEGIAVVSEDIENPKRNMAIALITIIILAFVFYIIYYLLILGALGSRIDVNAGANSASGAIGPVISDTDPSKAFDSNPINILIQKVINGNRTLSFSAGAGIGVLMAVVVASQLANKTTSRLMNGWVNARILAVIAKDGFLHESIATTNKYKQFKNALLLDLWLTMILVAVFYPLYLLTGYNIADAIDLYTISAFIQYLFILVIVIYLRNREGKKSSIKLFEYIAYIIIFPVLVFIVIAYFYYGFADGIDALKNHGSDINYVSQHIGGISTSGVIIILILFSIVLFYIGKMLGWHKKGVEVDKDNNIDYSHHNDITDIESQPNL